MINNLAKKTGLAIAPVAMTNSATQTANIDTLGADYATIIVPISTGVNTNAVGPTLLLKESDDTVVTNFATWSSSCTQTAVTNSSAKNAVFQIDTRSRKRYIRLSVSQPAASSMLASTNDLAVVL